MGRLKSDLCYALFIALFLILPGCTAYDSEQHAEKLLDEAITNMLASGNIAYTENLHFEVAGIPVQKLQSNETGEMLSSKDTGTGHGTTNPAMLLKQLQKIDKEVIIEPTGTRNGILALDVKISPEHSKQMLADMLKTQMSLPSSDTLLTLQNDQRITAETTSRMRKEMEDVQQTYLKKLDDVLQTLQANTTGKVFVDRNTNRIANMIFDTKLNYVMDGANKEEVQKMEYEFTSK